MDPNLMHVDWERTFEALTLVIIFAFLVERALAVLFESRFFIKHLDRNGLKELLAVGVAVAVCVVWKLDAVGMIILTETTTIPGYVLTGLVVAGGSKAAIKLFHDVLGVKSSAYDMRHEIRAEKEADTAEKAAEEAQNAKALIPAETALKRAEAATSRAKALTSAAGSAATEVSLKRAEAATASAREAVEKLRGSGK